MLANVTVNDRRNLSLLLDALTGSVSETQDISLRIAMQRMKDLMIKTKERLEAAKRKYQSAIIAFADLKTAVVVAKPFTILTGRTRILNRDIDDAIVVITEELDQIFSWTFIADWVNREIDEYPIRYLLKYDAIRYAFK